MHAYKETTLNCNEQLFRFRRFYTIFIKEHKYMNLNHIFYNNLIRDDDFSKRFLNVMVLSLNRTLCCTEAN